MDFFVRCPTSLCNQPTLKVSADEALGTDSYIGKINDATELSAKLDKLNPLHRDYASATLKLIVEYFSDLE